MDPSLRLPDFNADGYLEPGLFLASLEEVLGRFGTDTSVRERQGELVCLIVERARRYPTIKRGLLWGSFVTAKPEPGDLDYSIVVDPRHQRAQIAAEDRRFFVPAEARIFYGVDRMYLVLYEYPPGTFADVLDFIGQDRQRRPRGVVEVSSHG